MAFFRTYLIENDQTPDTSFDERDEAALVLFLLQARLRKSAAGLRVPEDFEAPEQLPSELDSPEMQKELKFITAFQCFLVSKPHGYEVEIAAFRQYYIPGFASDVPKQTQLAQGLRKRFFTATLDDLTRAETLDRFFNVSEISKTGMLAM